MDNTAALVARLTTALSLARTSDEDEHEHAYWALITEATRDGSAQTALRCGAELLASADALEREAGCDLIGYAADGQPALHADAATALLALAEAETDGSVLHSLACALERAEDARALPVLLRLAEHEDADIRRVVASAFTGINSGLPDGPDVRALIRLTRDQDADVRNWAAFTLGFQLEQDTPAIRAALWTCASDEDPEVRAEGARGLARRHDLRAVPLIAQLLGQADDGLQNFTLEAAETLGVPELLPALHALKALDPDQADADADQAIAACDPVRRAGIEQEAWAVVLELERLSPGLGAALSSPRYESVHSLRLTGRPEDDASYHVAALLRRAGGDPVRAAELVAADLG
ncbi:HEAT repeat domain-containing protein [Kitasatospora sp. NPDC006697]|uniref:HEAT repeat domain-containing protein n=1 Tax=Kitasatospora sp. NPDC006697 TaxID=3364020 RepID=UPI0036944BF0